MIRRVNTSIPWPPWKSAVFQLDPKVVVATWPTARRRSPRRPAPSADCLPLFSSLPVRAPCADGSGAGSTAPGIVRRFPSIQGHRRTTSHRRPPPGVDDQFGRSWALTQTTWHHIISRSGTQVPIPFEHNTLVIRKKKGSKSFPAFSVLQVTSLIGGSSLSL